MKLTMLGTGNAAVMNCYNTCFVISDKERRFMVDGGGGNTILNQLKKADLDVLDMHDIFVTHTHIDHILGIIWVIRMQLQAFQSGKAHDEVRIYGHEKVIRQLREFIINLLFLKNPNVLGEQLKLIEVKDGETLNIIGHDVTFFDIQSNKEKQFGFSMDLGDGEKLTCLGDEPYYETNETYAKGSKWLLHEAFCLYEEREIFNPYKKFHSTVKDACEVAEKLRVENLLLYHTEDKDLPHRKERYYMEGKPFYSGNLFIPDDLETIEL